jgi:ketosteroid isomerase-like protein
LVLTLVLAGGLVAGWLARAAVTPRPAEPDPAAETAALLQADREFAQMSRARGAAEAFAHYLADDALSLPAAADPVIGRDLIRQRLADTGGTLTWEPQAAAVSRAGDFGYTWGLYESATATPGGPPKITRGKYANVWRQGPDGRWRVVLDIGNVRPPATP